MLIEIIFLSIGAAISALIVIVCINLYRQAQVNEYFKKKSPNLPILDQYQSIFGGHAASLVYQKDVMMMVHKGHQKLGRTFGIYYANKPAVGTTDLDLIKFMIFEEPYAHINRMTPDIPLKELESHNLMCAEDQQWRRLRQASAPTFTNHRIKSPNVMNEINGVIDKFVGSLNDKIEENKTKTGENFIVEDADDIFHRYALALVFKCFYKQDNVIDFHAKEDKWVSMIQKGIKQIVNPLLVLCVIFPIIKWPADALLNKFTDLGYLVRQVMGFIEQQTKLNFKARVEFNEAKRLAKEENREFDEDNYSLSDGTKFSRNLIDYFIDQFYERKVSKLEYLHNSFFLFFAANKTTADALTMLIHHLALDQEVQDKLRKSIEEEGMESEYLSWCIHESLRLYPPAPVGCSRTITKDYTTKEGYLIPAGTIVYTSSYSIHRDPEYWGQDAEVYRPERWANSKDFDPVQFLAFGAGKRNCIGKFFAMHEIKMLMSSLLTKFKFERSALTSDDNSFSCPMLIFTLFEKPHYLKISKLVH